MARGIHVCVGDRCERIRTLRAAHWTYRRVATTLGCTLTDVLQSVAVHRLTTGATWCVTCRRRLDGKVPATRLLPEDECCGWCGRRFDGDVRLVIPLLARLGQAEAPAQGVHAPAQELRPWRPRMRANAAEVRVRRVARRMQADEV